MFGAPLPEGSSAPPFRAVTQAGETVTNETVCGRWVVLAFYPGDHTPT